jgi:SWI/SNF-related matrix-associated actin-dependent regulator of chromatin subfamily A-like protein 1
LNLFPYQEEGARWLAGRIRGGCFDDMGMGKSATAIRAMDWCAADRAIVICPATARDNWVNEFRKFGTRYRRLVKGKTIHDFLAWHRDRFDVLITSYEMVTKWAPDIIGQGDLLQTVIIDEGQYLKDAESARAKAILGASSTGVDGILQWAISAYWLSGTPVPNDPQDIYTFLRFSGCMPLTKRPFLDRFFVSRQRTYSAAHKAIEGMLPELQTLIANNSIRRMPADVGLQLPELWTQTYSVDGDDTAIRQLLFEHPGLDQMIIDHLQEGRPLSGLDADYTETLRRLIGEAKAVPYADMLLWELQHGGLDKMVVFGIHRRALEIVRQRLVDKGIKAALLYGETPERARWPLIQEFQNDPSFRVLICNIKSGGTALTMTASNRVDMLEEDWSPGNNAQALKRLHRIGQTRNVRARFIALANSFDETVQTIVAEKTGAIAAVQGQLPQGGDYAP